MQASPLITDSPISSSFISYSSEKLAKIAARVVREIGNDPHLPHSDHPNNFSWDVDVLDGLDRHFQSLKAEDNNDDDDDDKADQNDAEEEEEEEEEEDDDFEFAVVWKEADSSSTSADEIFYNGQIRPFYPLFNKALLSSQEQELSIAHVLTTSKETTATATTTTTKKSARSPLGKLFDEDRGEATTTSSSSSESEELDGVSPDTYCAWSPSKAAEGSPAERCKKSKSTGHSKRWRLRDLVFRSHSDGKETFVFLSPSSKKSVRPLGGYKERENNKKKAREVRGSVPAKQHMHYAKNKNNNNNNGDKRRSFLPYRQDLVGLFSNNVHGLNKNLHPF